MKSQAAMTIADGVRIRLDFFNAWIDRTEGCWFWIGRLDKGGYGLYSTDMAHRTAYRLWVGPIAEGLTVDHLCFVPNCVRPDHLRLLPRPENSANQRNAFKTHCNNAA